MLGANKAPKLNARTNRKAVYRYPISLQQQASYSALVKRATGAAPQLQANLDMPRASPACLRASIDRGTEVVQARGPNPHQQTPPGCGRTPASTTPTQINPHIYSRMAEPRAKKTNLACDSCRRRKRKCDGRTPICSLCEKGNIECVYDTTLDQRRPAQKSYVAALEARVALLEGILKDAGASDVAGPSGVAQAEEHDPTPQQTRAASPAPPAPPAAQSDPSSEPKFVPPDEAPDALKLMAEPQIQQENTISAEELDLGMGGFEPLVSLALEHQLLAQFWDWQRMHLPYVAPVPFLLAYAVHSEAAHPGEPIPPPPPPPPPNPFAGPSALGVPRASEVRITPDLAQFISPLLLDAMFAVAALFHGNPETSEMFYQRAKQRMLAECANPCLATVQGVCLITTCELGYARAPAAWTLSGVAVSLCVRLGMNIDSTPLVRSGAMSKRLFETRNFVFWATFNFDRFYATLMGMHPLMDRSTISTPRHSSLAAANVIDSGKPAESGAGGGTPSEKPTAADVGTTWWSPSTLGMGDVLIQAGWEAVRDLLRITDMLFDKIYAFNAPKRTPQEDLELVTRNNLTIQRFLDELPTWLRSTGAIRRKDNGLVYLHMSIHLTSILVCRPFLSARPLSEEAIRHDATTDKSQPTHSSQIIRRYRTLAFRVARASALQIMSLVRHVPLSSPCVTLPYLVYSAATILLLAPDDPAAMDAVRTGIACLDVLHETGYWVEGVRDASDRIKALARRWGVVIGPGKRVLGLVGSAGPGPSGSGSGAGGSSSGNQSSENQDSESSAGPSNAGGSNLPSGSASGAGSAATTRPTTSAGEPLVDSTLHVAASAQQPLPSATHDVAADYQGLPQAQGYDDVLSQVYAAQIYTGNLVVDPTQQYTTAPQPHDTTAPQVPYIADPLQNYGGAPASQHTEQYHAVDNSSFTSGLGQPASELPGNYPHIPSQQFSAQNYPTDTRSYAQPPEHAPPLQYARNPVSTKRRQELQRQADQTQYQQPHYQQHQHTHAHPYHQAPRPRAPKKAQPTPHVAYALSHAEPQHDSHLPYTHWHEVLPPDPTLPFPPDPTACMDTLACFNHTIEHTQDPTFVDSTLDPYAGVAVEWLADASCSFPAMTLDMYVGTSEAGPSTAGPSGGSRVYAQPAGDEYHGGYGGYGYVGGYGGPGM